MSFTKIPNELMEVLMSKALNNSERRILIFIARKTYGFGKKSDRISITQFEKKLDMARDTVTSNLLNLRLVGLVRLVEKGNSKKASNLYSIDFSNHETKLVGLVELVRYDRQKLVGVVRHTKESITKERQTDDKTIQELISLIGEENIRFDKKRIFRKSQKGWHEIIHPLSYLEKIKSNNPELKQPSDYTTEELENLVGGKKPGIDEGIDLNLYMELMERRKHVKQ